MLRIEPGPGCWTRSKNAIHCAMQPHLSFFISFFILSSANSISIPICFLFLLSLSLSILLSSSFFFSLPTCLSLFPTSFFISLSSLLCHLPLFPFRFLSLFLSLCFPLPLSHLPFPYCTLSSSQSILSSISLFLILSRTKKMNLTA